MFKSVGTCLFAMLSIVASGIGSVVSDDFSSGYPDGGTGWVNDWTFYQYHGNTPPRPDAVVAVTNTNPFGSAGNYLSVSGYMGEQGYAHSNIYRTFDKGIVDTQTTHTVSFDFRLDESPLWGVVNPSNQDNWSVFARHTLAPLHLLGPIQTDNTWGLTYGGASGWQIITTDGAGDVKYVAPSAPFFNAPGSSIFNVVITILPESKAFKVSISDGVRTEDWGGAAFGFIDQSQESAGDILYFYNQARDGVVLDYSLDNIQVVPEPNAAALAAGSCLLLAFTSLLRKKKNLQSNRKE